MLSINNISKQDREEIIEITKMLENVPTETRNVVKGFLVGAEYTEQALKEAKKSA